MSVADKGFAFTLPDRESWLEARRNGLGASDVPAALGLVPWKPPMALWAEKCGMLPEPDAAELNEAAEWGNRLEPQVIQAFADRTGRLVKPGVPFQVHVHPKFDFLRCTLDATQRKPETTETGDLQAKTTSHWNAHDWADGAVPLAYQVQVQAELFVTDMAWGSICVLIGGQRFLWRDIERDDEFITAMIPPLSKFWQCVLHREQPEVDASLLTGRILAKMHPQDSGATVTLPDEAAEWQLWIDVANAEIKALEEKRTLNQNRLKAAIGPATFGIMPDGSAYSYKTISVKAHEVKASEYRKLQHLKGMPK